MKRKHLTTIFYLLWVVYAATQAFDTPDYLLRYATPVEKAFVILFIAVTYGFCLQLLHFFFTIALLPFDGKKRGVFTDPLFFTTAFVVCLETFWLSRGITPNVSFHSPARLAAAAGCVLAGAAAGFVMCRLAPRKDGDRAGMKSEAACVLALGAAVSAMTWFLFVHARWDLLPFSADDTPAATGKTPNVVVITLDTTSANYTSLHGYPVKNTPNLERIAAEGVSFDNAIVPVPLTLPSHATIMTGLYPRSHKVFQNTGELASDKTTLAEVLKQNGYKTAQFFNMMVNGMACNMHQGFDVSYLSVANSSLAHTMTRYVTIVELTRRLLEKFHHSGPERSIYNENVFEMEEWLKTAPEPFFLWYHSFIPHTPYNPPPDIRRLLGLEGTPSFPTSELFRIHDDKVDMPEDRVKEIKNLYAADIMQADRLVGRLLDSLAANGFSDNTLLIITSDHGESFQEQDPYVFGHSTQVYQSAARVPFLVRFPDRAYSGARMTDVIPVADVFPTVLDYLGIALPSPVDGQSLLPLMETAASTGGPGRAESFAVTETYPPEGITLQTGLVSSGWQYVINLNTSIEELYDFDNDRFSADNLLSGDKSPYSEVLDKLRTMTGTWQAAHPYIREKDKVIDKDMKDQIKNLGYVE